MLKKELIGYIDYDNIDNTLLIDGEEVLAMGLQESETSRYNHYIWYVTDNGCYTYEFNGAVNPALLDNETIDYYTRELVNYTPYNY